MRAIAQFTITDLYDAEGMEVGARNLLLDSGDERNTSSTAITVTDDDNGNVTVTDIFGTTSGASGDVTLTDNSFASGVYTEASGDLAISFATPNLIIYSVTGIIADLDHSDSIMVSVFAKSSAPMQMRVAFYNGDSVLLDTADPVTVTTSYERYVFSFDTPTFISGNSYYLRVIFSGNGIGYVRNIKAEFGNVATSWTPAPEDVDSNITAVSNDLTNFITGEYADDLAEIAEQIDSRCETWYQSSDPSESWTTTEEKEKHIGDLWYDTSIQTTYRWSGTVWQEQNVPIDVFDQIDEKAQIFLYSASSPTPTPPYAIGDLWIDSANDLYKCIRDRSSGETYAAGDWVIATKYTDDTAANNAQRTIDDFIQDDYAEFTKNITGLVNGIETQIDNVSVTWYYDYAPSASKAPTNEWTTTELRDMHCGDMFYNTSTGYSYIFTKSGSTYSWSLIRDAEAATALANAATAQDTADNKRRVFYAQPTPPYDQGDLWVQGANGDIYYCSTAKASGSSFAQSDWSLASKYTGDEVANSKAQVYYGTTNPPSSGTYNTGDIWVKRVASGTGGDVMYYYNGSSWVMHAVGTTTIKSGSIVTDLLASNAVTAAKIDVNDLFAQNITATGTITGATLIGPTIRSNSFSIYPQSDSNGSFNIYGYYGGTQYHMFQIAYNNSGDWPTTIISSPASAYASWDFTQTYVSGSVDFYGSTLNFSGATIQNLTANSATYATKATQDGSGNTITTTYVARSGSSMSGNLGLANGVGIYGTTTSGATAWIAYINSSNQMQYGSSSMPVYFWTNGYFYVRKSDGSWVNLAA